MRSFHSGEKCDTYFSGRSQRWLKEITPPLVNKISKNPQNINDLVLKSLGYITGAFPDQKKTDCKEWWEEKQNLTYSHCYQIPNANLANEETTVCFTSHVCIIWCLFLLFFDHLSVLYTYNWALYGYYCMLMSQRYWSIKMETWVIWVFGLKTEPASQSIFMNMVSQFYRKQMTFILF